MRDTLNPGCLFSRRTASRELLPNSKVNLGTGRVSIIYVKENINFKPKIAYEMFSEVPYTIKEADI